MTRFLVRTTAVSIFLTILAALPVAAKIIPKGVDYWVTRVNSTNFTFPDKDVESLCKAAPGSWDHKVTLQGVPAWGSDWDSAVARLIPAIFDKDGDAHTLVQFKSLEMVSSAPSDTPCGKLNWRVRLAAKGKQPITKMKIIKDASGKGGVFHADLALRVELQANRADTGAFVGSLFYDIKLDDPAGGTPWSYGSQGAFLPGVLNGHTCIDVLREKLGTFPKGSNHIYFISNLIAKGDCREKQ
jgi:hypothetical protein